jgi:hypothetical protein
MEQSEEVMKAIEQASDGYWFPLITVTAAFSLVIALLLYIWNQTQKVNNERHSGNESLIKELVESKHTTDLILAELKLMTSIHEKKFEKLEG